jgi:Flp pilus assembly protein TadG
MWRLWKTGLGRRDPVHSERGAVLAEFALVAPVLLMLVFGVFQLGLAFSRAQAVEAAAREGGRLASLSSTSTSEIVSRVNATLVGTTAGAPTVTVAPGPCDGRQGESVTVTVSVPHRITIPLTLDRDVTLTGQAVFRCEA